MKQQSENQRLVARYRGVIISIVLFILIIIAILGINIFATGLINKDTAAVNAVSSLQDRVQGINKSLFDLRLSYGEDPLSPHMSHANKTLSENSDYIDSALESFSNGGELKVRNNQLTIDPVESSIGKNAIKKILPEWQVFQENIKNYLVTASELDATTHLLDLAVNKAQSSGVLMYNQVNRLADDISNQAEKRAKTLQLVQIIGITIAILYFFIFLFFFIRRLRDSDKKADAAKEATDSIMKTVNEGLFLVDEGLTIDSEYSAKLESIIGQQDIGGKQLHDVLEPLVSGKDIETLRKFIKQLFNAKVKEKLIQDLNPLNKVEIQVLSDEMQDEYETRYLTFNFSRVYKGKQIRSILASVSDITRSVILEQRLEQEREQNDQQLALLSNVLHADEEIMSSFIRHSNEVTNNINEILKRPELKEQDLIQKTHDMFREIHGLKGEASAMKLDDFVILCNNFEDKVETLQRKANLNGNDFLSLTVDLEDIIKTTNKVDGIFNKLGSDSSIGLEDLQPATDDNRSALNLNDHFTQYTQEVAARNGKQVSFRASGLDDLPLGTATGDKIKDTITQLIRNAIAHGIEDPAARSAAQKNPMGIVRVQVTEPQTGMLRLTVDDDGNGIDVERIRAKAVAMGLYSQEQANALTKQQLQQLIFNSGLSTASAVGEDAGRGVGMDVIKERVKQLSGQIGILSEQGKYTRFVIQFPA